MFFLIENFVRSRKSSFQNRYLLLGDSKARFGGIESHGWETYQTVGYVYIFLRVDASKKYERRKHIFKIKIKTPVYYNER